MWWMRKETGTSYKKGPEPGGVVTVCPRTKLRMMTPEEAARSFPRLLEEDLLVPLLVTGGSMVPFTAPPGCGIHSGNPLPEPPGGGCDFVLPGGGDRPWFFTGS